MSAVLSEDLHIRPVLPEHLAEIHTIEQAAYDFPWTEGLLSDCLKTNYNFYAMFRQGSIVAYGVMTCVLHEAHILNLCVRPEEQGQGLGRMMLEFLLDKGFSTRQTSRPIRFFWKYGSPTGLRKAFTRVMVSIASQSAVAITRIIPGAKTPLFTRSSYLLVRFRFGYNGCVLIIVFGVFFLILATDQRLRFDFILQLLVGVFTGAFGGPGFIVGK